MNHRGLAAPTLLTPSLIRPLHGTLLFQHEGGAQSGGGVDSGGGGSDDEAGVLRLIGVSTVNPSLALEDIRRRQSSSYTGPAVPSPILAPLERPVVRGRVGFFQRIRASTSAALLSPATSPASPSRNAAVVRAAVHSHRALLRLPLEVSEPVLWA